MKIHYLEIVTPDVEAHCKIYSGVNSAEFGEPDPRLGNARTADMPGGGRIGIRAPMSAEEAPVTRPYYLVENIKAAVKIAEENGSEIIHPPLEIPGLGTFAICLTGDIQHGLWKL